MHPRIVETARHQNNGRWLRGLPFPLTQSQRRPVRLPAVRQRPRSAIFAEIFPSATPTRPDA